MNSDYFDYMFFFFNNLQSLRAGIIFGHALQLQHRMTCCGSVVLGSKKNKIDGFLP